MWQQKIIIKYLKDIYDSGKNEGWFEIDALTPRYTPYGWLNSQAIAECRKLVKKGYLKRRKKGVEVRYDPSVFQEKPMSDEEVLKWVTQ